MKWLLKACPRPMGKGEIAQLLTSPSLLLVPTLAELGLRLGSHRSLRSSCILGHQTWRGRAEREGSWKEKSSGNWSEGNQARKSMSSHLPGHKSTHRSLFIESVLELQKLPYSILYLSKTSWLNLKVEKVPKAKILGQIKASTMTKIHENRDGTESSFYLNLQSILFFLVHRGWEVSMCRGFGQPLPEPYSVQWQSNN